MFWRYSGVLVLFWCCSGDVLAVFWQSSGVLVFWWCSGDVLAVFWQCSGVPVFWCSSVLVVFC